MRIFFHFCGVLLLIFFVSSCELLCQAGTGTCGMSREEMRKALNPKSFGEYFVKSGMSQEDWRRDWLACGGLSDGGYSSDAPSGSTADVLIRASKQKRQDLVVCMESKGYEYKKGFEYRKSDS